MPQRPPDNTAVHIPALDGLRGLAILLVLAFHTNRPHSTEVLFRYGWLGVDLFFVLSGFLITRILISSRESPKYFSSFYVRRILRIWPVYFALLLVVLIFERTGVFHYRATLACWLTQLTFTQNWYIALFGWDSASYWLGPTWSLGIEEQFYVIWPLLIRKLSTKVLKRICFTALLLSPVARALASIYFAHDDGPMLTTFTHFDGICLGSLIALYYVSGAQLPSLRALVLSFVVGFGTFALLSARAPQAVYDAFAYSALAVGCAALLLASLPNTSASFRLVSSAFSFAPLRFIGKISYCLYLVHLAAFSIAESHPFQRLLVHIPGHDPHGWSQIVANWLLSFVAATVSWYCYESPILKLKSRFTADAAPKSLVTGA